MEELEKMRRAKMYLDKLAVGIDPLSDCEISDDSVINNVRICRCLNYISDILEKVIANGGEIGRKVVVTQLPFSITPEQKQKIQISEDGVGVTIISKRIAAVLDSQVKPLSAVNISGWLHQMGYLSENTFGNKKSKVASPQGEALGITTIEAVNSQGINYKKNVYNSSAQRYVIDNLEKIAEFVFSPLHS
jgi:hypothetical protein